MRYFAYGSNMDPVQMAVRCPGAAPVGVACLRGWRLTFDRFSDRRGGHVADVVPDETAATWGVLWDVTDEHLAALDRFEGVGMGAYRRSELAVHLGDEAMVAAVYVVCEPTAPGLPPASYLDHLVSGARAFGLPAHYLRMLEGFRSPRVH